MIIIEKIKSIIRRLIHIIEFYNFKKSPKLINLCSGDKYIDGYLNIDYSGNCDLKLNLNKQNLPIISESVKVVLFHSAVNYFTYSRAQEIISEIYRSLESGGVLRISVQDLEIISKRYVEKDNEFFFKADKNGEAQFEGETLGDKYVAWFYGYKSVSSVKYFYDYQSLSNLIKKCGFKKISKQNYSESSYKGIGVHDNRPEQMFFVEAVK